jgi:hypothetical protein
LERSKHDVCVLNENGGVIATTVLPHTADGLLKLEAVRQKLGVAPVLCSALCQQYHQVAATASAEMRDLV